MPPTCSRENEKAHPLPEGARPAELTVSLVLYLSLAAPLLSASPADDPRYQTSGVLRRGEELLFVSDELPGAYLTYRIADLKWDSNCARLAPEHLTAVAMGNASALDLEGIGQMTDGRLVLLSERLRSLIGNDIVVQYDDPFGEFGNAGMEGVAIRSRDGLASDLAVLWEGGYIDADRLPPSLDGVSAPRSVAPFLLVHTVTAGTHSLDYKSRKTKATRLLQVPTPPGQPPTAQRFRAPDLVWLEPGSARGALAGRSDLVVLLNSRSGVSSQTSTAETDARRSLLWLQRFSLNGAPIGTPLDIDSRVPAEFRSLNWEGLGWWSEGRTLILVDDAGALRPPHQPPVVCRIDIPIDWKRSSP